MNFRSFGIGVGILCLAAPLKAEAGGMFLTNGYTQVAPSGFRAALWRDGERQTVIESTTFNLNPLVVWNFLWLIPVPSEPEVEFINDDFFEKMDRLTRKKFAKNTWWKKLLFFDIVEVSNQPVEPFTRAVNVKLGLKSGPNENLEDLTKKINDWGYLLPKGAKPHLAALKEKGWWLVGVDVNALHIQMDARDSLTVFGAHTLPVKMSFKTDKLVYPLKLAAVQPDLDSKEVALSFDYGVTSDKLLGAKDEVVDSLLSYPSQNEYPSLPLDLANLKIELFVFGKRPVRVNSMNKVFADYADREKFAIKDKDDKTYFEVPEGNFLTRLVVFKPMVQLEDLEVEEEKRAMRVNPNITSRETLVRIILLTLPLGVVVGYLLRNFRVRY